METQRETIIKKTDEQQVQQQQQQQTINNAELNKQPPTHHALKSNDYLTESFVISEVLTESEEKNILKNKYNKIKEENEKLKEDIRLCNAELLKKDDSKYASYLNLLKKSEIYNKKVNEYNKTLLNENNKVNEYNETLLNENKKLTAENKKLVTENVRLGARQAIPNSEDSVD